MKGEERGGSCEEEATNLTSHTERHAERATCSKLLPGEKAAGRIRGGNTESKRRLTILPVFTKSWNHSQSRLSMISNSRQCSVC